MFLFSLPDFIPVNKDFKRYRPHTNTHTPGRLLYLDHSVKSKWTGAARYSEAPIGRHVSIMCSEDVNSVIMPLVEVRRRPAWLVVLRYPTSSRRRHAAQHRPAIKKSRSRWHTYEQAHIWQNARRAVANVWRLFGVYRDCKSIYRWQKLARRYRCPPICIKNTLTRETDSTNDLSGSSWQSLKKTNSTQLYQVANNLTVELQNWHRTVVQSACFHYVRLHVMLEMDS